MVDISDIPQLMSDVHETQYLVLNPDMYLRIHAALTELEARRTAKPIAWRYRETSLHEWVSVGTWDGEHVEEMVRLLAENGVEVEPLYLRK